MGCFLATHSLLLSIPLEISRRLAHGLFHRLALFAFQPFFLGSLRWFCRFAWFGLYEAPCHQRLQLGSCYSLIFKLAAGFAAAHSKVAVLVYFIGKLIRYAR